MVKLPVLQLLVIFLLFSSMWNILIAQDSTSTIDKVLSFPDKLFSSLNKKAQGIEGKLDQQTSKYLNRLQRQEHRLKRKLLKKDSALAQQVFGDIDAKYNQLRKTSGKVVKYSQVYSGHLDSLSTALNFVKTSSSNLASNPELQKALTQYSSLQEKLNATDLIQKQLVERRRMLTQQLNQTGMVKELRKYQKQVYYYQAQVREYKQLFEDPSKLEQKLVDLAMKVPQFRDFFRKNSLLSSFFSGNGNSSPDNAAPITGLQPRDVVSQSLMNRFGSSKNISQVVQKNIEEAQGQLGELRNKLASLKEGNYGDELSDLPNFKPNSQKTKQFLQRLELGTNFQTQHSTFYYPTTTDLAVSVGYRLNDHNVIGIGGSYKVGWGQDLKHFSVTHEGIGFRSFIDMRIKGSFFVSGGAEYNYQRPFSAFSYLNNINDWSKSGLVGVSKIINLKSKFLKKSKVQALWDFLSYRQKPSGQAFKFRIGYNF